MVQYHAWFMVPKIEAPWHTHCMRKRGLSEPNGLIPLWVMGSLGSQLFKQCFELHDFTYFRVLDTVPGGSNGDPENEALCMHLWEVPHSLPAHSFSWNSATKLSCWETADTLDMSTLCIKLISLAGNEHCHQHQPLFPWLVLQ